jgi:hypothetical protein
MYSFEPTEEQKMLVETVARYASSNLRPASHDADEECQLPLTLIKKGWGLGVLQASMRGFRRALCSHRSPGGGRTRKWRPGGGSLRDVAGVVRYSYLAQR